MKQLTLITLLIVTLLGCTKQQSNTITVISSPTIDLKQLIGQWKLVSVISNTGTIYYPTQSVNAQGPSTIYNVYKSGNIQADSIVAIDCITNCGDVYNVRKYSLNGNVILPDNDTIIQLDMHNLIYNCNGSIVKLIKS